jgi:acetylornithine deacetylase
MINTTELLAQLVAIDSRNPALGADAPGELHAAKFVATFLLANQFDVTIIEPTLGRPSVLGRLPGSAGGAALMLNGHLDTVGFGGMPDPLDPRVADGRMRGRGSYDMKGGVAAILAAAAEIAAGPRMSGDLYIAAVADEEHASIGTEAVLAYMAEHGLHADYGIVAEPTDYGLCVAHKGFVWATISTGGQAAHGSAWQEGIDAIARMGRVLVAIEQLDQDLHTRAAHPLLGVPSLHASLIRGGVELSTYPAHCELQIERRTIPGESVAQVWSELDHVLNNLHVADPRFRAELALGLARSPMEAGLNTPIVAALRSAGAQALGRELALFGMSGWTDAALMADAGIASVLFGPCGHGAHADQEWVDLASVANCAAIYADVARQICG